MSATTKTRKPATTKTSNTDSTPKTDGNAIAGLPSETVGRALADRPEGATVRELASATKLATSTVAAALKTLKSSGLVVGVPGRSKDNPRTADVWKPASAATSTPDDTTPDTTTDADADTATDDAAPADTPATSSANSDAPATTTPPDRDGDVPPEAPTSGAPVRPALMLRHVVVGAYAVLGEYPDGITAPDLIEISGMRHNVAPRVLGAMEAAGAARRLPPDENGTELWVRGDADPTTVDVANAPTHTTCPTCGKRRPIIGPGNRPRSTEPGVNSDGQRKAAKGELRQMVLEFINANPGQVFTAGIIAKELQRSSGAIRNNLDYLLVNGLVQYADDGEGKQVTALATKPDQL